MPRARQIALPVILTVLILALAFFLPREDERMVEKTRFFMGTIVEIKVPVNDPKAGPSVDSAIEAAFEEIGRIDDLCSVFKPTSEVAQVNRLKAAQTLHLSQELFDLIERSFEFTQRTQGAFDITVKPLVDAWRMAGAQKRMISEIALKDALDRTGPKNVILDKAERTIMFTKDGMGIDLGGVAKGYATDRAVGVLRERGIDSAVVRTGGDVFCLGAKSRRVLWNVGVRHPRNKDEVILNISLRDKAIDTSGDYEKYFMLDGKRYSHIIDPRTGYPIGDQTVSATIIASGAMTADMLATALCVLGPAGLPVVESVDGADAIVVYKSGGRLTMKMTGELKKRYAIHTEKALE